MYCGHSPTCINMKRSLLTGSSPSIKICWVLVNVPFPSSPLPVADCITPPRLQELTEQLLCGTMCRFASLLSASSFLIFFYKVSFYNPNWNVHNVLVNWCHYKTLAILGCLPDRCTMLLQLTYNTFFWKVLYNVSFGPHRFTSLRVEGALCCPLKGIYVLKQKKIWKLTDGNWASCGKMVKNICVEIF